MNSCPCQFLMTAPIKSKGGRKNQMSIRLGWQGLCASERSTHALMCIQRALVVGPVVGHLPLIHTPVMSGCSGAVAHQCSQDVEELQSRV